MPSVPVKSALTEPQAATPNEFSFALLAELESPARCLAPRLTLELPNAVQTVQLSPDADVDFGDSPSFVGGSSAADVTDDAPSSPDGDTSYLAFLGSTEKRHGVSFPDMPTGAETIPAVRLFARVRRELTNSGLVRVALRVGGTEYYGDTVEASDRWANTAYRTIALTFALNPDTGLAWTEAAVNTVEAVFDYNPDAGVVSGTSRATQFFLEVDYTTTLTGRYSSVDLNSATEGLWEGRVVDWGRFGFAADGKNNAIQDVSVRVRIADHDFAFASILEGDDGNDVRRAAATIELVSPNVDPADWKSLFVGVLQESKEVEPNIWELELRPDDQALDGTFTSKIPEADFGAADPKAYDKTIPLIYGRHSALDLTNEGQVELPYVDTANFRYLVCLGRVKSIDRVYTKDGDAVAVEQLAGWSVITPIINGRQYTLIEFTADQGTKAVRIDLQGYEETGDGTGILLENPADCLKHFLVNFVFNSYTSGLWLADSLGRVDVAKFTETREFFNDLGVGAARYLGGSAKDVKGRTEVNNWARQFEAKVFWTGEGNIGCRVYDFRTTAVYQDNNWYREGLHDLSEPSYSKDSSEILAGVEVSYLHSQADNSFLANISVEDFQAPDGKTDPIKAEWFPSAKPVAA